MKGAYNRLCRFDNRGVQKPVFWWGNGYARATSWVGVMQVADVQIEVLPKIETASSGTIDDGVARDNLIYMLATAGDLRARDRGGARVATANVPMLDVFGRLFADGLLRELLRGADSQYIAQQDNLRKLRGKVLIPLHVRANMVSPDRVYCGFDEFSLNTTVNRAFKATCQTLHDAATTTQTVSRLRQCLSLLEDVDDVLPATMAFRRVSFNRQNERFAPLFEFARKVLEGDTPTLRGGEVRGFSVFFDMNAVFEKFMSSFVKRYVEPRLTGRTVLLQARNSPQFLLRDLQTQKMEFRLKPDVLVCDAAGKYPVILDTKWKAPRNSRPDGADVYQMNAYLDRYASNRCVLLYPKTPASMNRDYERLETSDGRGQRLQIRFVDLARNLRDKGQRRQLADELLEILGPGS